MFGLTQPHSCKPDFRVERSNKKPFSTVYPSPISRGRTGWRLSCLGFATRPTKVSARRSRPPGQSGGRIGRSVGRTNGTGTDGRGGLGARNRDEARMAGPPAARAAYHRQLCACVCVRVCVSACVRVCACARVVRVTQGLARGGGGSGGGEGGGGGVG